MISNLRFDVEDDHESIDVETFLDRFDCKYRPIVVDSM